MTDATSAGLFDLNSRTVLYAKTFMNAGSREPHQADDSVVALKWQPERCDYGQLQYGNLKAEQLSAALQRVTN
ncbi:MAG: hypothetical protein ACLURV_07205 [Gallintestinimicrobium sp.]